MARHNFTGELTKVRIGELLGLSRHQVNRRLKDGVLGGQTMEDVVAYVRAGEPVK